MIERMNSTLLVNSNTLIDFWGKLIVVIIFFAAPLRLYVPTTFILEMLFCVGILYCIYKKKIKVPSHIISYFCFAFYFFLLFLIGLLLTDPPGSFVNENYRFFFFYFIYISLLILPLNYVKLLKWCFYCCVFHIFFSIYEVLSLNIFSIGNYENVILVGKAMALFPEDSAYLQPQWEFGLPFIRPWGIMLQPQKSGFVLVLGIYLAYLLGKIGIVRHVKVWYVLFFIALLCTGAKTALLTGILALLIIKFDIVFSRKLSVMRFLAYSVLFVVIVMFLIIDDVDINHIVFEDVVVDTLALFNYSWYNVLFGVGIPDYNDLIAHGYTCECFYARILAQLGIINFALLVAVSIYIFKTKDRKINLLIFIFFFGLVSHYCIINVYFIAFALALIISYYKKPILTEGHSV